MEMKCNILIDWDTSECYSTKYCNAFVHISSYMKWTKYIAFLNIYQIVKHFTQKKQCNKINIVL